MIHTRWLRLTIMAICALVVSVYCIPPVYKSQEEIREKMNAVDLEQLIKQLEDAGSGHSENDAVENILRYGFESNKNGDNNNGIVGPILNHQMLMTTLWNPSLHRLYQRK
ncbi:unnamed protein product [Anisakis simplex]|uniref:Cation_ATPase_N domain-containing protein n=1 Tax=Anisakis simplex TaxID=6269 RepID=A0A0M3KC49_ANISI|nr:unnamed protein product [Anisakis simplex]